MSITAHIGIRNAARIPAFVNTINHEHDTDVRVYADGDGFACWGDRPGKDINDHTTLHIVLVADQAGDILRLLRRIYTDDDLVPIGEAAVEGEGNGEPSRIIFTDSTVWSEMHFALPSLTTDPAHILTTADHV